MGHSMGFRDFCYLSVILALVLVIAFMSFGINNLRNINDDLKTESYERKNEIDELRKYRYEASSWYEKYIDLVNQCGADE